jgi:hypothetical protein
MLCKFNQTHKMILSKLILLMNREEEFKIDKLEREISNNKLKQKIFIRKL